MTYTDIPVCNDSMTTYDHVSFKTISDDWSVHLLKCSALKGGNTR